MIVIQVNGKPRQIAEALSLQQFLEQNNFFKKYLAVALNESFVARDQYAATIISEGDRIEIVTPMCGG